MATVSQIKNRWRADWIDDSGKRRRLKFNSKREAEEVLARVVPPRNSTGLPNLLPEKTLENSRVFINPCRAVPRTEAKSSSRTRDGSARKHGFTTLKRAVNGLGNRVIDKRTATGKALAQWRKDLVADLGNDVSVQQSTIVDLAVKSKLLLDSIDVWLLTQESLVNKRKKCLIPVVKERQALADGLARYLTQLGLERKVKEQSLDDYLAEKYSDRDEEDKDTSVHEKETSASREDEKIPPVSEDENEPS